jgi:hypothetical protein
MDNPPDIRNKVGISWRQVVRKTGASSDLRFRCAVFSEKEIKAFLINPWKGFVNKKMMKKNGSNRSREVLGWALASGGAKR